MFVRHLMFPFWTCLPGFFLRLWFKKKNDSLSFKFKLLYKPLLRSFCGGKNGEKF